MKPATMFDKILSESALQSLAGRQSFGDGELGFSCCDSRLLIRLAAELEASRLDDAGVLYRRLVSETVARTWVRAEFKRKRNFIGMLDRCGFAAQKS